MIYVSVPERILLDLIESRKAYDDLISTLFEQGLDLVKPEKIIRVTVISEREI